MYDKLREILTAKDLLARLNIPIVREAGSELLCDPLCHESTSREALQINTHTGRWICRACDGINGDLIQFAEYALTGGGMPSRGSSQSTSQSHRDAVRWLCEQYAIPYEPNGVGADNALDVVHLFAMAAHDHLLASPDVLAWVQDRWGFDRATVEQYGIGYMPSPLLPAIVRESSGSGSMSDFRSSGVGFYPGGGVQLVTPFEGRVLFPYLEMGRAVYLIGRSTQWTPKRDGRTPSKYYKLPVHSDTRPYISKSITNDHLYNEPVLAESTTVVVAEGVADAVALSALGVPVVSPVTINFNKTDLERFVRKCGEHGIGRVEILFDNELSGSGNHGARRAGMKLVRRGLAVTILTLPLGAHQLAARDEVMKSLGEKAFAELERAEPKRRKEIVEECDADNREWVHAQIAASKIDAAEWAAIEGAGAAGKLDAIRKAGRDVVELQVDEDARDIDMTADALTRLNLFAESIVLAAHVDERMMRALYAGAIAKAAGKSVSKADVLQRISKVRKQSVLPARKDDESKIANDVEASAVTLNLLPPEVAHSQPAAPAAPEGDSDAPAAPPAPGHAVGDEHDRYASVRQSVMRAVDNKADEEALGKHVAQTVTISMGYTPFRTPDELYLVRGNERVAVGVDRMQPRFRSLIYRASGLSKDKSSHRPYIAAAIYFLEHASREAADVSWSHVGKDGSIFFPTGDLAGRIIKIGVGTVERTRMAEARVPAVAGHDFMPFEYVEEGGGIERALTCFKWTSLSDGDRLVLIYWLVCLPVIRKIGAAPIVRIEGGSASGKTRAVDAVSVLVNGRKSSSVPTSAAMISRLSTEMLTIDDNRESADVNSALRGTLLQATNLGAREKRKGNSDTGTVIERVCGALLMNGIEPIHDGKSELASRMLTLQCSQAHQRLGSPRADDALAEAIIESRDLFWSDATRRCARALELDEQWGEGIGANIEEIFGNTRIGRLSRYLRLMYFAWVAGFPEEEQAAHLEEVDPLWRDAFSSLGCYALQSLIQEELSVTAIRYAFAHCRSVAEQIPGSEQRHAYDGKFVEDTAKREMFLGPMRASHLARIVRSAAKDLNAPGTLSIWLRAGQLGARLIDGLGFLREAGIDVDVETTRKGVARFAFRMRSSAPAGADASDVGDPLAGAGRTTPSERA